MGKQTIVADRYLRQSKDVLDDRLAITRQDEDCDRETERRGWMAGERFCDNDTSASRKRGKKLKPRPDFERLLARMATGKCQAVLVGDPDRLVREPLDGERFIDVADENKILLASPNGDYDLATDGGRLMFRIKVVVAKAEMERKSARQVRANQQRRTAGEWSTAGQRPFGYTKHGQPLEPEASLLKKAATEVLGGRSMRSVVIEWNQRGVTTTRGSKWTNLVLRRVLSNPLYAALMTYEGKVVGKGTWEPLLEENIHLGLVAFLSDPARKRGTTFETKHQGSGVYRCGICGNTMYAGYPHRKDGGRSRMTYLCRPSSHVARVGEPLDAFINNLVVERLSNPKPEDEGRLVPEDEDDGVDVVIVKARKKALRERLNGLARQCARGDIDEEQLASATAELKPELDALDAAEKAALAEEVSTDPVDEILKDGPEGVAANWEKASPNARGKVINRLMTVTVNPAKRGSRMFDDQYIDIDWKKRSYARSSVRCR
jgi:site-specific DNA recombinase